MSKKKNTLIDDLIIAITDFKDVEKIKGKEYLTIKQLAAVLGVKYKKVYDDCKKELIEYTQRGPEDSGSSIIIERNDAIDYVRTWHNPNFDETPDSKLLFPELAGENHQAKNLQSNFAAAV